MEKLIVYKTEKLEGEVVISGAKNSVLKILAATILAEEECVIENVPSLSDVHAMVEILRSIGHKVKWSKENELTITPADNINSKPPEELVRKLRASIVAMGPLLARVGKSVLAQPGGCAIGERKVDLHIKGMEALGANITQGGGYIDAECDRLIGSSIYLDFPSVGATENIMMAATLAEGVTVIENAAKEPEMIDLANFLNKLGANVKGAGTDTIKIKGVKSLKGANHIVLPDRIEAGTFMVAAAVVGGDVLVKNIVPDHLKPVSAKLVEAGADLEIYDEAIRVKSDSKLKAVNIKTLPYPGMPTDMQAQFMILDAVADGNSTITETIFEDRFNHVAEMKLLGADISVQGHSANLRGVDTLKGAFVKATDLRAGAALVIAGLIADGFTTIDKVYHIYRGYDKIIEKFGKLGVKIEKKETKDIEI